MKTISFQNSAEFKNFTAKICSHLDKTKLNQMRHAFSKELGFKFLDSFYKYLDEQSEETGGKPEGVRPAPETAYNGMRVVSFPTQKGGTGKTSWGLLLSETAASKRFHWLKKRVLVIDFDTQQNISESLLLMETGKAPERSPGRYPPIHPEYKGTEEDEGWNGYSNSHSLLFGEPVYPYPTNIDGVDCLPCGHFSFSDLAGLNKDTQEKISECFKEFFQQKDVQDLYDLVIIDCPAGDSIEREIALDVCTDIILTGPIHLSSINYLKAMDSELSRLNRRREFPINVAAVIPYYQSEDRESKEAWEVINSEWRSNPVFGSSIVTRPLRKAVRLKNPCLFGSLIQSSENAELKKEVMDAINLISIRMYGRGISLRE